MAAMGIHIKIDLSHTEKYTCKYKLYKIFVLFLLPMFPKSLKQFFQQSLAKKNYFFVAVKVALPSPKSFAMRFLNPLFRLSNDVSSHACTNMI